MRSLAPALMLVTGLLPAMAAAQTVVPVDESITPIQSIAPERGTLDEGWRTRGVSMFLPRPGQRASAPIGDVTGFTPRRGDLRLGITVTDTTTPFAAGAETLDIGVSYGRSFSDVGVTMESTLGIAQRQSGTLNRSADFLGGSDTLGFGAAVEIGRFTLGGSFDNEMGLTGDRDGGLATAWDVGVGYRDGPWGLSLSYSRSQAGGGDAIAPDLRTDFGSDATDQVTLGFNYRLADGVDVGAFGAYTGIDDLSGSDDLGGRDRDVEGFVIGSGVEIDF